MPCNANGRAVRAIVVGLVVFGVAPVVVAQSSRSAQPRTPKTTTPPAGTIAPASSGTPVAIDSATFIVPSRPVSDTGRMARPYIDFSGYSVSACEQMFLDAATTVRRRRPDDVNTPIAPSNGYPPVALEALRRCMTPYTPANVPSVQMIPGMGAYLMLGDSVRAAQVLDRWLREAKSVERRAEGIMRMAELYLSLEPARADITERLIARVDSLGDSAAIQRAEGQFMLLGYWSKPSHYDPEKLAKHGNAAGVAFTKVPADEKDVEMVVAIFSAFWMSEGMIATQGRVAARDALNVYMDRVAFTSDMREAILRDALTPKSPTRDTSLYGKRAPAVNHRFAFDLASGDGWPAQPGQIAVFVPYTPDCDRCGYRHDVLRRLSTSGGDAGISVTLVARTGNDIPGAGLLPIEEEAKKIREMARVTNRLPFGMLIEETRFDTIPDGRRVPRQTPYQSYYGDNMLVIDQGGNVAVLSDDIDEIKRVVDRLVATPVRSVAAGGKAGTGDSALRHAGAIDIFKLSNGNTVHIPRGIPAAMGDSVRTVPMELLANLMFVTATVDGKTGLFILDTGNPVLILNTNNVTPGRVIDSALVTDGVGHTVPAYVYSVSRFDWGGESLRDAGALGMDLRGVEQQLQGVLNGRPLFGLMGLAQLAHMIPVFDYSTKTIALYPVGAANGTSKTTLPPGGDQVPMAVTPGGAYVTGVVDSTSYFKLDSGDDRMGIDGSLLPSLGTRVHRTGKGSAVIGVGGAAVKREEVTLDRITIGKTTYENVEMRVQQYAPNNMDAGGGSKGTLGASFFLKNRVGLDLTNKRMYIWKLPQ